MITKSTNLAINICKISYQKSRNVDSIIRGSSKNKVEITFEGDHEWEPIYFSPGTADFKETPGKKDAGPYFNQKLSFKFPGMDDTQLDDFNNWENERFVVKIEYGNGLVRLMGSNDIPAIFEVNHKSNSTATNSDLEFTCKSSHRSMILEEPTGGGGIPD